MGYKIPTFNLFGLVWHDYYVGIMPPVVIPDNVFACQLRYSGRGPYELLLQDSTTEPTWQVGTTILMPKDTDVRDHWHAGARPDLVEVPSGSGRYYFVHYVDDVAKGFANEYRIAYLGKTGDWPTPIP